MPPPVSDAEMPDAEEWELREIDRAIGAMPPLGDNWHLVYTAPTMPQKVYYRVGNRWFLHDPKRAQWVDQDTMKPIDTPEDV